MFSAEKSRKAIVEESSFESFNFLSLMCTIVFSFIRGDGYFYPTLRKYGTHSIIIQLVFDKYGRNVEECLPSNLLRI